MPGRTDNDVKNFWNLYIKRLERVKRQHVSMQQTSMETQIKMEEEAPLAKEECKSEESEEPGWGPGPGCETERVHKESECCPLFASACLRGAPPPPQPHPCAACCQVSNCRCCPSCPPCPPPAAVPEPKCSPSSTSAASFGCKRWLLQWLLTW